jgi:hypothetical protein
VSQLHGLQLCGYAGMQDHWGGDIIHLIVSVLMEAALWLGWDRLKLGQSAAPLCVWRLPFDAVLG